MASLHLPASGRADGAAENLLFLLTCPLYVRVRASADDISGFRTHAEAFDSYCPECGRTATWRLSQDGSATALLNRLRLEAVERKVSSAPEPITPIRQSSGVMVQSPRLRGETPPVPPLEPSPWLRPFVLRTRCTRQGHEAEFHFHVAPHAAADADLVKFGQFPSLTDFQLGDLSAIDEGMTRRERREFVQAINTGAHGFAVAAFVYYRRVFESILVDARDAHISEHNLTDWPEFDVARTDERIKLLRGRIPQFVSENPHLYALLSKGVHELSEEECASELQLLRSAIELVLTDRAEKVRATKHRANVERLLAQATDRHKR